MAGPESLLGIPAHPWSRSPHWRSVFPTNGQGPLHWPCVSFPSSRSGRSPRVTGPFREVRIPFPSKVLPWNCPALAGTSVLWPLYSPINTEHLQYVRHRIQGNRTNDEIPALHSGACNSALSFSVQRYLNYGGSDDSSTSIIRIVRHKGQEIGKPEGARASVLCWRMAHLSTRDSPAQTYLHHAVGSFESGWPLILYSSVLRTVPCLVHWGIFQGWGAKRFVCWD